VSHINIPVYEAGHVYIIIAQRTISHRGHGDSYDELVTTLGGSSSNGGWTYEPHFVAFTKPEDAARYMVEHKIAGTIKPMRLIPA
jgi:hypothetical protein